jgi:methanogenic corrinoid protein MtbC1
MLRPHRALDKRASEYLHAVLDKDRASAEALVRSMIDSGSSLVEIYGVLGAAQVEVGALWERGVITVSDEHFATGVTLDCISMAADKLRKFRREPKGLAVLRPAEGEFHSVGLRMLSELLRSEGWETELRDSGPMAATLKGLAARKRVDLFCLSATMPSNTAHLADAIRLIRKEPAFKSAKVVVGGPAFEDAETRRVLEAGLADCVAMSLPDALEFARSSHR